MVITIKKSIVIIIASITFIILITSLKTGITKAADETDLIINQIYNDNYYSEYEGVAYEFTCSPYTKELSWKLEHDYDGSILEDSIELESNISYKYGYYYFKENGTYTITAFDGTETIETELLINVIDYKKPEQTGLNDTYEFLGPYLSWYNAFVNDYFTVQKKDVSSGLDTVMILRDIQNGEGFSSVMPDEDDDEYAYRDITPTVIKSLPVDVIAEHTKISNNGIKYNDYIDFDIDQTGGTYYVYAIDRVGNVLLQRLFDMYDMTQYQITLSDGTIIDYTETINLAATRVAEEDSEYAPSIIKALSDALDRIRLSFARKDDDEILAAAKAFDIAQTNYTNAIRVYNLELIGSGVFPDSDKIVTLNFDDSTVSILKGQTAKLTLTFSEFREDYIDFEFIKNAMSIEKANRLYKIDSKLTIDGETATLLAPIRIRFAIPSTFSELGVSNVIDENIIVTDVERGNEWLILTISYVNQYFYVIINDENVVTRNMTLIYILIALAGLVFVVGFIIVVLLVKKQKKLQAQLVSANTTDESNKVDANINSKDQGLINKESKSIPHNKSKKKKR
ncbi:MAG: hypothetical protein LBF68_04545 [Christensenellaceae bacterium]|jgi:hypothetical protein|nr:hypothetical protein [Christensenellaceae bacterium]